MLGDPIVATAVLDRLLHHAVVIQTEGASYRLRAHADLIPEHVRANAANRFAAPPKSVAGIHKSITTEAPITEAG